ncbi:lantibiotic dehydratase [Streptomyces microflavus]|uniref:lantibiotic dehydratase n=1 Tax=Streptomyces microflavus TaxID=1919 RepID=UPI0036E5EAF9
MSQPSLLLSSAEATGSAPDGRWLAQVSQRLEASSALRRRLTVVINDQAVVRGGR